VNQAPRAHFSLSANATASTAANDATAARLDQEPDQSASVCHNRAGLPLDAKPSE
jgi:hypothetical protein